jgi:hypothetical protein
VIDVAPVGALVARLARAGLVDPAMALAGALLNEAPTTARRRGSVGERGYVVVLRELVPALGGGGRPAGVGTASRPA